MASVTLPSLSQQQLLPTTRAALHLPAFRPPIRPTEVAMPTSVIGRSGADNISQTRNLTEDERRTPDPIRDAVLELAMMTELPPTNQGEMLPTATLGPNGSYPRSYPRRRNLRAPN